jgi:hypothetical protein
MPQNTSQINIANDSALEVVCAQALSVGARAFKDDPLLGALLEGISTLNVRDKRVPIIRVIGPESTKLLEQSPLYRLSEVCEHDAIWR